MFRLISTTSIVSMALGLTTLAGCASNRAPEASKPSTTAAATAAMQCPTCETVRVTEVTAQGTKIQRFASKQQMSCPTCEADAVAYLTDGGQQKVLHNCPQCAVTPTPQAPVSSPQQPSHPKGTHS